MSEQSEQSPRAFWEDRYAAAADRVWSGNPNPSLTEVITLLTPGTALELAAGEGADAIWLAQHGWQTTGVDFSETALEQARKHADDAGVRVDFVQGDLDTWEPGKQFDLVSSSFLHSPVELDRTAILRRSAAWVAPGGAYFILGHAAPPPWAKHHHQHDLPTLEQELANLAPGEAGSAFADFSVERANVRERQAIDPDGNEVTLEDNVILLKRA